MAYDDYQVFQDFRQSVVRLAKEVFEDHIKQFHPEICGRASVVLMPLCIIDAKMF